MAIKIELFIRMQLVLTAFTLTCAQSVSAQNAIKTTVQKNVLNGGTMKSDKSSNESPSGLSISSPGDISNTKSVNVNGDVNMTAGKSITNGSSTVPATIHASSSVTLKAPTIHNSGTISAGSGSVNISTTNLINSGSITAKSGDVNISNHNGNSLLIDNSNGSITGKTVNLKVNDLHESAKGHDQAGSITVKGGTIGGESINIGGRDTKVDVNSDKVDGKLNVPNSSARIHSKHNNKTD